MNKDIILLFLLNNKSLLREQFGVLRIGLFGSYARNQATNDSDIDLMVEFSEPKFEYWAHLKTFIENELHSKTDIVRLGNHLSPSFINQIKNEVIYV